MISIPSIRRYGPCDPNDLKDRMASAVALLGKDEVQSIIQEQGKIEVTCEYVNGDVLIPDR